MATLYTLIREMAAGFTPDFRLWRIDLTLEPAFAAEAERDLADAGVIITPVNGRQSCPPEFQRWKAGTGHGGGEPPHAIITLMGASAEGAPAPKSWDELLRNAATKIDSEMFVCESGPGRLQEGRANPSSRRQAMADRPDKLSWAFGYVGCNSPHHLNGLTSPRAPSRCSSRRGNPPRTDAGRCR